MEDETSVPGMGVPRHLQRHNSDPRNQQKEDRGYTQVIRPREQADRALVPRRYADICGEDIQASSNDGGAWALFVQAYQQKYQVDWDSNTLERIRRVACKDGTHMTINGYILLTKLCDFPLNLERLPSLMDSHATVSAQTRMEVAKMVNELITYYSTREMRDLIVSIFTWYKGYNKRDHEAWQGRANDWAHAVLANRGKTLDEMDDEGRLAEQVDMARRTYSFFFQRYMVIVQEKRVTMYLTLLSFL
jgi:hypothetical protein